MIEERKCKNCGAPLKSIGYGRYKCEYCGTEYELDNVSYCLIETVPPECISFEAQSIIPEYIVKDNPETASKIVSDQLAHNLADRIKDYMTIHEGYNPRDLNYIYRGRIRIVPESYKYASATFNNYYYR